jgi:hypothetical protein
MVVVSDLWPEGHTWQGCSPLWFRLSMYVHHLLTSHPVIILPLPINVNLLPEYIVVIADHGEPSMRSPSFNLPLPTLYLDVRELQKRAVIPLANMSIGKLSHVPCANLPDSFGF